MSQQEKEGKRTAPPTGTRRKMPLTGYLIILFAVAFLLLFMAYCQQQRQNTEAQSDALKQSVSAVDTIQTMIKDNQELRDQVDELKEQVATLTQALSQEQGLSQQAQSQAEDRGRALEAMDWFWQINEAYVRQRYSLCRELIQSMESQGLVASLPDESITDNGRFSPAKRYEEIREAVG